ncbi:MAG: DUF92 domain-containing protein [Armatimonadetes bacterium]|nr:MAG: DUF92 domain-containing protein [Armatimonadota bacterium]
MLYAAALAALAALCRWLTLPGSVAAFLVGALIYEAGGVPLGIALVLFFLGAVALGRLGVERKRRIRLDEPRRNAAQVVANGGIAAACSLVYLLTDDPSWLLAAFASICAASADTWATEFGTAYGRKFFHITTLQPSEPGPNGVVSPEGLFGAFLGSSLPGLMLVFAGRTADVGPIVAIGFLGSVFDSILGDTLEGRWAWMGNNLVNLLTTLFAALAALLYAAL